jgi:hypothetical protein
MGRAELLIVGANLVLCTAGFLLCVTRMGHMSKRTTKLAIRVQYAMLASMFTCSAISWTYDDPASITQLAMTGLVLGFLLCGNDAWKYGAPIYTMRVGGD